MHSNYSKIPNFTQQIQWPFWLIIFWSLKWNEWFLSCNPITCTSTTTHRKLSFNCFMYTENSRSLSLSLFSCSRVCSGAMTMPNNSAITLNFGWMNFIIYLFCVCNHHLLLLLYELLLNIHFSHDLMFSCGEWIGTYSPTSFNDQRINEIRKISNEMFYGFLSFNGSFFL